MCESPSSSTPSRRKPVGESLDKRAGSISALSTQSWPRHPTVAPVGLALDCYVTIVGSGGWG
jgi:hypothetical protein